MISIAKEELESRIQLYLSRAEKEDKVQVYNFNRVAFWEIVGGYGEDDFPRTLDPKNRLSNLVVRGRYIDALVYALKHPEFYGWHCNGSQTDNPNHGYVKIADIKELERQVDLNDLQLDI